MLQLFETLPQTNIPLLAPYLTGKEVEYLQECLQSGWITTSGKFIKLFEEKLQNYTLSPYVVVVVSGTAALHLALKAVGVTEKSIVLLPNSSFVATANAIHYCNAEPIFIDIHPKTWQIDERLLEKFLQKHCYTKEGKTFYKTNHKPISALIVVHNLGNIGNMQAIIEICQNYSIPLVEDAAEALGSFYKGKHAGTFGEVGILSFNGNKIITTGGGGAVLTKNSEIAQKIRHWANQAKTHPEEYYHDTIGYNYRLSNPLAAIGVAQMESLEFFLQKKKTINTFYHENLSEIADFQDILHETTPNYWLSTALFRQSNSLIQKLKKAGIQTRRLWYPLNRLPMHKNSVYIQEEDYSFEVYQQAISLPSSVSLTETELHKIVQTLLSK